LKWYIQLSFCKGQDTDFRGAAQLLQNLSLSLNLVPQLGQNFIMTVDLVAALFEGPSDSFLGVVFAAAVFEGPAEDDLSFRT